MASIFLRSVLRPHTMGMGLGLTLSTFAIYKQGPLRLDSKSMLSTDAYKTPAQSSTLRNSHLNPGGARQIREISSGSILGLCAGVAVSTFSRPLALLLGLLFVGIQWAASYGINVLPYDKLRRYITNVDSRSALQDNIAFKLSFGLTFAMAAFMHF